MSSIYRFQARGLDALWLRISVSTLPINILAKATAILVPMAVPCVYR